MPPSGLFGEPDHTDWTGRTLSFIRQILGEEPRFADCVQAMEASHLHTSWPPPIGAVCWYRNENPHGNVGLSLGDGMCLGWFVSRPQIVGVTSPVFGEYVGWSYKIGDKDG